MSLESISIELNVECDYDGGDCCPNPELIANSVCNDENNIVECSYDGGDCCPNPIMVGNGICNDVTNNLVCTYDGGDCCSNPNVVGDGICNNETNNLECNYDGEDCCGPAVSCKYFVLNLWNQSNDTILSNANIILKKVIPTAAQQP